MKITLENTDKIIEAEVDCALVNARVWEGTTESGIPVVAFIVRISPQTHDPEANALFARELIETRKATIKPFAGGISLRYIL
jgi:hypothetical protein